MSKVEEKHEKSLKSIEKHIVCLRNRVFGSSRLRDPIWDPPGLRFGSLLAFKMPARPPQERPRLAQERPRRLQDSSKSAQEASQTAPRGLQDRSKRPSGGQEAPRGLRGAS